jgi:hypothetical protein
MIKWQEMRQRFITSAQVHLSKETDYNGNEVKLVMLVKFLIFQAERKTK